MSVICIMGNTDQIIIVHANGCVHCEILKPVIEQIQTALEGVKGAPSITLIEAGELSEQREELNLPEIRGYPTIMRGGNGNYTEYNGQRDFNSLKNWILEKKSTFGGKKKRNRKQNTKKKLNKKRMRKNKLKKYRRKTSKR